MKTALAQAPAYRDAREVWEGVERFLTAGAEMLARCRVRTEREYLRDTITEAAAIAVREWHGWNGPDEDRLPDPDLAEQVEDLLARAERQLQGGE